MTLLLLEWSLRRVRDSLAIYFRIARLTIDWTTVVYLYIPALAFLIYESTRYYRGLWFRGMAPDTPLAGPLTFRMIAIVVTFILILLLHLSAFGQISFPLRSGDKAFVLSAPLSTHLWFWTLWLEGWVWLTLQLLIVVALTLPILWFLHASVIWWCLTLILCAAYINTARFVGALWKQQDDFRFWRFLLFQVLRVVTFIPLAWIGTSLSGQPLYLTLWILPIPLFIAIWVLFRMEKRLSWDPLFRTGASPVLAFAGASDPASHQIVYNMRAPSGWLTRGLERVIRRRISPVAWLLLIRSLRTRGLWRTYVSLSMGAVFALRLIASGPIKFIGAGFFLFLIYQYWKLNIRPLVRKPSIEQTITDWPILTFAESRLLMWVLIVTAIIWILLWQLNL